MAIELTKDEIEKIIKSGNLYFAHPVNLNNGIYPVKTLKKLTEIAKESSENVNDYDDVMEIFTYWENKETPMFDIIVYADNNYFNTNNVHLKYELSDTSLFGMYWLVGNKPSPGMINVSEQLDIPMPRDVDLEKYTRNNFEIAKAGFDFN